MRRAMLGGLVAAGVLASAPLARDQRSANPRPQPAIAALVEAFDRYPLVAIAEAHRNQQIHDFIVSLLDDPRFQEHVNDIVVEFGNARFQDVVNRYTSGGAVPVEQLRPVWRDTVNILVWDAPVYERVFTTVRAINQHRPPGRQLRVLLAGPPIDWGTIERRDQWERIAATTDEHAAAVIEQEVLSKQRRALLIFGSGHVTFDGAFDAYGGGKPDRKPTLAEILRERHPGAAFLVWFHMAGWMTSELDPRLASWPRPALALLAGTWLGAAHVGPPSASPTLEALADGFLYLGPTRTLTDSKPRPEIYRDPVYLRELIRRNAIQGGFNTAELEALKTQFPLP